MGRVAVEVTLGHAGAQGEGRSVGRRFGMRCGRIVRLTSRTGTCSGEPGRV